MNQTGFHLPHNAILPDEVKFILSLLDENKDYYLYDDLKAMMFEEEIKQGVFETFHAGMYSNFMNNEVLKDYYSKIKSGDLNYADIKHSAYSPKKDLNGCWNEQARDYFEFIAFTGLMPSYYKGRSATESEKRYYIGSTLKKYKSGEFKYQDILFKMKFRNASKNYDNIEQYDVRNRPFVVAMKIMNILKNKGYSKIDGLSLSYMIRNIKDEDDLSNPEVIESIRHFDFSNSDDQFKKELGRGSTFLKRHLSEGLGIQLLEGRTTVYNLDTFDINNYSFKDKSVFIGDIYGDLEVTPLFLKYLNNPSLIDNEEIKNEMNELGLIKNNISVYDYNPDTDLMDRYLVIQYLTEIVDETIYSTRIEATDLFREGKAISEGSDGTAYEEFLYNLLKNKFGSNRVNWLGAHTIAQRLSDITCDITVRNDDISTKIKLIIESKAGSAITAFDERKEKNNILNTLSDRRYNQDYDGIWYIVVDSNKIPTEDRHGGFRENNNQVSFKQKLLSIQSTVMPYTQKLTMVTAFGYAEFMKFIDSIDFNPDSMSYITKIQAPDFWTWSNKFVGTSYVTVRA